MPHICTRCNNVFESGEDILKGCPACGWKKFMFVRKRPAGEEAEPGTEHIISRAMGVRVPPRGRQKVEAALRLPSPETPTTQQPSIQPAHAAAPPQGEDGRAGEDDKLESIKITSPGTYELNLPSLFERDELIMAVKEGTYFIDLTSAFRKGKKD